jgi:hypothetical protein
LTREAVARRPKYLTRKIRQDAAFCRLLAEFETWADTSPDRQRESLRWAVSLYHDAVGARVRLGERIRDVLQRGLVGEEVLTAVGSIDVALVPARAGRVVLPIPVLGALYTDACGDEARAAALLESVVSRHAAWPWLSGIGGIGPVLAGRLLSRLDIHRAPSPASFWAYCGLATVPGVVYRCLDCGQRIAGVAGLREAPPHRRPDGTTCPATSVDRLFGSSVRVAQPRPKRGESRGYDAHARHACYLIGLSFVRKGAAYKAIYAEQHTRISARHAEWPLKRIQLAAQRAIVKRFLTDLWLEWRRLEALPIVPAYSEKLRAVSDDSTSVAVGQRDSAVHCGLVPRHLLDCNSLRTGTQ